MASAEAKQVDVPNTMLGLKRISSLNEHSLGFVPVMLLGQLDHSALWLGRPFLNGSPPPDSVIRQTKP